MYPYIHLSLGSFHRDIPTFGLMLWVAAVAAGLVMDRNFRRFKISADAVGMVAITVIAGIVGAKLWHVLDTPSEFRDRRLAGAMGYRRVCLVRRPCVRHHSAG